VAVVLIPNLAGQLIINITVQSASAHYLKMFLYELADKMRISMLLQPLHFPQWLGSGTFVT